MGGQLSMALGGHRPWRFAAGSQWVGVLGLAAAVSLWISRRSFGTALASAVAGPLRFAHLPLDEGMVSSRSSTGRSLVVSGLQPVLPGHTVVLPRRPAQTLADLSAQELRDFVEAARGAQEQLRAAQGATAFNWALKDGLAAGQPVPHVHLHVVPRRAKDLEQNDLVYELIDKWSPVQGEVNVPPPIEFPSDEDRRPRTQEVMAEEARGYAALAGDAVKARLPADDVSFGKSQLKPTQIFYASASGLTLAVVNLKPLVPGHVLIIPRRVVPLMGDLTEEETQDLWETVRDVQRLVKRYHGATASTLGVQDGRDAGQSVPHVHVHILPQGKRKASL